MEFVHRCHFCGWKRDAASPTILEPNCQRCGSLLDSIRKDELASEHPVEQLPVPTLRLSTRAANGLRLSVFATVLFTAAASGLEAGGPWIALAAVGAGSLAAAPALVPR